MKLAIADPPYLGRAATNYGPGSNGRRWKWGTRDPKTPNRSHAATTEHPDANQWDNPQTHIDLVADLEANYDGWAIAMWRTSLPVYLAAAPTAHVAVWVKPAAIPGGGRLISAWEPVLVRIPNTRRHARDGQVRDVITEVVPGARHPLTPHTGAKPARWTRWVLDMMGYDPDTDTVVDLFPGSGAVARAVDQGVLW